MEKIRSVWGGVRYRTRFEIDIPTDKKTAKQKALDEKADIIIYTDGSEIDGRLGAAATIFENGRPTTTLRYHIGSSKHYGIPEAEIIGEILAAHLLVTTRRRFNTAIIGPDNVGTIQATQNQRSRPGQYLVDTLLAQLDKLYERKPDVQVTMRWTPGHVGVPGNEYADKQAKKAAEGDSSPVRDLPKLLRRRDKLPHSKTAAIKTFKASIKTKTEAYASSSKYLRKMARLDPTFKPSKYAKTAASLPRRHSALLVQLRSGHAPVQKHLHRIKRAATATCPGCGTTEETVMHYLLHCRKYKEQRKVIRQELGRKASEPSYLLSNTKALPALFRYIAATKRFDKSFGTGLELSESWKDPHTRTSTGQTSNRNGRRDTDEAANRGPSGSRAARE
jgi:ribonuclease HI